MRLASPVAAKGGQRIPPDGGSGASVAPSGGRSGGWAFGIRRGAPRAEGGGLTAEAAEGGKEPRWACSPSLRAPSGGVSVDRATATRRLVSAAAGAEPSAGVLVLDRAAGAGLVDG